MKSEVQDSNHAIDVTHMMLTETQERCLLGSLKDALEVHFIDASQYNNDSQNLGGQPYFVATIARRNDVTSDK